MGEWREVRLGDLGEVNRGRSRHRPRNAAHLYGGPYPFIQTGDIKSANGLITTHSQTYSEAGLAQSRLWPEGTMVITIAANIAETAILTYPACFPDSVVGFIVDPSRADVRFIEYLFRCHKRQIQHENVGTGSVQDNINLQTFDRLTLRVPSLSEQCGIASLLGVLDDKIELNRRTNETLEAMARAIFKDWFVDFGPTRAKAEGHAPYLTLELWDLFPDALDDEYKPVGWRAGKVGDCFHLTMGQSPPGSSYNDNGEGLPFFQGRTDFGFRFPGNRKYCTAPTRTAERDDTLVSVRAPVGDINMVWEKCCVGRGVAALRHKSGSRSFTYYSAWEIQQKLQQYEHTGTVFGAINKKQFEALTAVEPIPETVSAFEHQVGPLDDRIAKSVSESQTLAQTRDFLLPKLMSGEIRLREAEKAVESVA